MAVNLQKPSVESTRPVAGLSLGTAKAGIRKPNRRDLTVVTL
jgi:glutamate N-acetyltransferase/amino-acid N-acetyltransferase